MRRRDPLRQPYELGLEDARRNPGSWLVLAALIVTCVATFSVGIVMSGAPVVSGRMIEAVVPDGPWVFEWGSSAAPPSVEQQERVRALRAVVAGAAALVAMLCLLTVAGLWRQRLLLRRHEHLVHWAVGARTMQIAARAIGESRRWIAPAAGLGLLGTAGVAAFVERTFPGAAPVGPNVAAASLLLVAVTVLLVRWESSVGERARKTEPGRFWEVAGSPATIGAIGLSVLTGVGILVLHAPYAQPGEGQGREVATGGTVVSASLGAVPMEDRGEAILGWTARAENVGFASAGAARGTGRRDRATLECGECFEGTMYTPLRVASVEVYAVAPDTFVHLGMSVSEGRDFDDAIDRGALDAAIVTKALAARHFQDGDALGRHLMVGASGWLTVVGVVEGADGYAIYLPMAEALPTDIELLFADPAVDPSSVIAAAPPGADVGRPTSRAAVFGIHRWFGGWLNGIGGAALILLAAGLSVSGASEADAARYEISMRRAVGARRRSFWVWYVRFAGRRLAFMLVVGAWLSLFLGAGLQMTYDAIPQVDWRVWCAASLWVSTVYVLGSLPPIARGAWAPLRDGLEGNPQ